MFYYLKEIFFKTACAPYIFHTSYVLILFKASRVHVLLFAARRFSTSLVRSVWAGFTKELSA